MRHAVFMASWMRNTKKEKEKKRKRKEIKEKKERERKRGRRDEMQSRRRQERKRDTMHSGLITVKCCKTFGNISNNKFAYITILAGDKQ